MFALKLETYPLQKKNDYNTAIYVRVSIKTRFFLFDNLYGTRDIKGAPNCNIFKNTLYLENKERYENSANKIFRLTKQ